MVQRGFLIDNLNFRICWPPLVEVVNSRELPSVLIERYNAAGGEGTALCGIFPEIHRAWASVDNSLFLWRFDKWDGQCSEYSGDEWLELSLIFNNFRRQYLNNAVIQAKSASESDGLPNSVRVSGLLDLLEGKLTVLQFQIRIKEELESVVCKLESAPKYSEAEFLQTVKEKVKELSLDLKSITQLYNEYDCCSI
ncbi:putative nucleoporin, nucleoporin, protein [Helianthus anomalus]